MIKDNNKNKQQQYDPMTELELTKLAEKIVAKMMRLKTVEDWFKHMTKTKIAEKIDYENLELTEEEYEMLMEINMDLVDKPMARPRMMADLDAVKDSYSQEEEYAIGQIAKLMTLLNLFQENEQYEKCAIVKRRLDIVNDILKKYDDDEI